MEPKQHTELTGPMRRVETRIGRPLREYLRERYEDDGCTTSEIAASLGLSSTTVARWLDFFGIELRFPGQRGKAAV
jgi:transposase